MAEGQLGNLFLITTPIQDSWPNKGEVIFLGEWCKLYFNQKLNRFKFIVLDYHWNDRKKLEKDFKYLEDLYEVILESLYKELNKIHNVRHSKKYWRILIGFWLGSFLHILFDRWENIRHVDSKYIDLKTICLKRNLAEMIPQSFTDFKIKSSSDEWNHHIYCEILKYFNKIEVIEKKSLKIITSNNPPPQTLKTALFSFYSKIATLFLRKNSPLILTTYMSKLNELLINLKFGQLPIFINLKKPKAFSPILNRRNWKIHFNITSDFEKFVSEQIPSLMPTSYLEGYKDLEKKYKDLRWPENPKIIFSSNSFFEDDIFKSYAAHKSENGTKINTSQHGGHFGIGKLNFYEDYQLSISDNFISWGWNDNNKKIQPFKFLKGNKLKKNNKRGKGIILLVTCCFSRYSYTLYSAAISSQWLQYFDDQIEFINELNKKILKDTVVRISPSDFGWEQINRWKEKFPNLSFDEGKKSIKNTHPEIKLYISTYNATTFLESISNDIPTIIFWNTELWEIRESAQEMFNLLEKVKIFHKSPKSAAYHLNNIIEDVTGWWNREEVKTAVTKFKNEYCNSQGFKVKELKNILK